MRILMPLTPSTPSCWPAVRERRPLQLFLHALLKGARDDHSRRLQDLPEHAEDEAGRSVGLVRGFPHGVGAIKFRKREPFQTQ
jgi:hypothetical protein